MLTGKITIFILNHLIYVIQKTTIFLNVKINFSQFTSFHISYRRSSFQCCMVVKWLIVKIKIDQFSYRSQRVHKSQQSWFLKFLKRWRKSLTNYVIKEAISTSVLNVPLCSKQNTNSKSIWCGVCRVNEIREHLAIASYSRPFYINFFNWIPTYSLFFTTPKSKHPNFPWHIGTKRSQKKLVRNKIVCTNEFIVKIFKQYHQVKLLEIAK